MNKTTKTIVPKGEWLIISHNKNQEKVTEGGIVIPDMKEERHTERLLTGVVVSVGPGKRVEGNSKVYLRECECKVGDIVLYSKYAKGIIETDDPTKEFHNVKDSDIVAILK